MTALVTLLEVLGRDNAAGLFKRPTDVNATRGRPRLGFGRDGQRESSLQSRPAPYLQTHSVRLWEEYGLNRRSF